MIEPGFLRPLEARSCQECRSRERFHEPSTTVFGYADTYCSRCGHIILTAADLRDLVGRFAVEVVREIRV